MKINTKGLHLKITDALKDKINKEIDNIDELIINNSNYQSLSIDLSVNKSENVCHLKLVGTNLLLNVEKNNEDMYDCISESFKTLKQLVVKEKEKKIGKKRKENMKSIIREGLEDDPEEYPEEYLDD